MSKPHIICIDDQREILAALQKDLSEFEPYFRVEVCESAEEAGELLEQQDARGGITALLICDHVMPGQSGIDFLINTRKDPRFSSIPSIVLTGLATHQDTITAINQAGIQAYIEKPWNREELLKYAKQCITPALLKSGLNYQEYLPVLDSDIVLRELHQQTG